MVSFELNFSGFRRPAIGFLEKNMICRSYMLLFRYFHITELV